MSTVVAQHSNITMAHLRKVLCEVTRHMKAEQGRAQSLVQILHDLLQQWMQAHVSLGLLQQLDQVHMVCDKLPEVCHLLEHFGEKLEGVGVVHLQLELQGMEHRLLEVLNGLHIEQPRSVCRATSR